MVLLSESITNIRSQLDELGTQFIGYWNNNEIRAWVNDAVRDIARRTETILTFNSSLPAVAGQAKYNLPADVIRVHRIEFVPTGSTQVYPVVASTYDELDQVWGINQLQQSSYPCNYACWGPPGSMTIQFFPVPAASGTFNLFYYAMPVNLAVDGSQDSAVLNIPAGWDDLVVNYVTYRALMKSKSQEYQLFKALYDETLNYLMNVTRQAHDNGRYVQTQTGSVPNWLYNFSDE